MTYTGKWWRKCQRANGAANRTGIEMPSYNLCRLKPDNDGDIYMSYPQQLYVTADDLPSHRIELQIWNHLSNLKR